MNLDIEQIIREYVDKSVHLSLATSKDNKPWVCEVHFAYDGDLNLYFVSQKDTRHCQEIKANPHVAGNIVAQHDLNDSPHGIDFEGSAKLVAKPTEDDINRYCTRLARDKDELEGFLAGDARGMYKITVKNWAAFGKFGTGSNNKYELEWNGNKK